MKKITLLLLSIIVIFSCNNDDIDSMPEEQLCDNGTFSGNAYLFTQEQIIDFGSQCYTKIDGRLYIGNRLDDEDITDLSPLSSLIEITDELVLRSKYIVDFSGLENLQKIGGLRASECNSLINFNGLEGLTEISRDVLPSWSRIILIRDNPVLNSLNGLDNLVKVLDTDNNDGVIKIECNTSLTNIDSLSSLIETNADIELLQYCGEPCSIGLGCWPTGPQTLTDFCGLQNLFTNGSYQELIIVHSIFYPTIEDIISGNCSI